MGLASPLDFPYITAQYSLLAPSAWTDGVAPFTSKTSTSFNVSGVGASPPDYKAYQVLPVLIGQSVNFSVTVTINSGTSSVGTNFYLVDQNFIQLSGDGSGYTISGAGTFTVSLTANAAGCAYLLIDFQHASSAYDVAITLNNAGQIIYNASTTTITIKTSKDYLLNLCRKIFSARDFANVDQEICTAVKIMVGLQALELDSPQSISVASRQQILVTLNNICNIYNPQMGTNF